MTDKNSPPNETPLQSYEKAAASALKIWHEIFTTAELLDSDKTIDLYQVSKNFDSPGKVIDKLDKLSIGGIDPSKRGDFFRYFCSAVITETADNLKMKDKMVEYGLIGYGQANERNINIEEMPALGPISDKLPGFSILFLGYFQTCLKARFSEIGMIPYRHLNADCAPPNSPLPESGINLNEINIKGFNPMEFVLIIHAATLMYLRRKYPLLSRKDAEQFAQSSSTILFLLLGSTGLLSAIGDSLISGSPLLRMTKGPDGDVQFIKADEGPNAPFFGLEVQNPE
jgi:hypothetical protein